MAKSESIVVVIVDDDAEFGSDLGYELEYISRSDRRPLTTHFYTQVDEFIDDLSDDNFTNIDVVLLDENAEIVGGQTDEASQISLPKLYAVRQIGNSVLENAYLVIYSGILNQDDLNKIRMKIGTFGGHEVWEKTETTAQDFYDRIRKLNLSGEA